MSKSVKRKITVELPKPRDLTKNRLSVFQRLGTKKSKSTGSVSMAKTQCPFTAHKTVVRALFEMFVARCWPFFFRFVYFFFFLGELVFDIYSHTRLTIIYNIYYLHHRSVRWSASKATNFVFSFPSHDYTHTPPILYCSATAYTNSITLLIYIFYFFHFYFFHFYVSLSISKPHAPIHTHQTNTRNYIANP